MIVETRAGDLLLGTNGGGIMRLASYDSTASPKATFEPFTAEDGLASNLVRDLYEDQDGFLWVATEDRGLCRLDRQGQRTLRGAALACLDRNDGLYVSGLHRILEDDDGRFWFNTNQGLFWVQRNELNAFIAGEITSVTSVSYTERDGMLNREGNGGVQPAGIKAADGRLWFPTQEGAVIVDPTRIRRPEAPPVMIETVTVEDSLQRAEETLVLQPGERDVEIQ